MDSNNEGRTMHSLRQSRKKVPNNPIARRLQHILPRIEEDRIHLSPTQLDLSPPSQTDPYTRTQASTPTPPRRKSKSDHIPRPANAFMLFRSDLVKQQMIPFPVEQQEVSWIAGQCWKLLPSEGKEMWQDRAKQAVTEHLRLHPDYKYSPAPRRSRRPKATSHRDVGGETNDSQSRIRTIREEYVRILGPTASPAKRPRRRIRKHIRASEEGSVVASPVMKLPETQPLSWTPSPWFHQADGEDNREALLSPLSPFSPLPYITSPQFLFTPIGPSNPGIAHEDANTLKKFGLTSALSGPTISSDHANMTILSPSITSTRTLAQNWQFDPSEYLSQTHFADTYLPTLDESFHTFSPAEGCLDDSETIGGSSLASPYDSNISSAIPLPTLTQRDYPSLSGSSAALGAFDLSEFNEHWSSYTSNA